MNNLYKFYPYPYVNFDTLMRPNSITDYTFGRNYPFNQFNETLYNKNYNEKQLEDKIKAINLYNNSNTIERDGYYFPVYNTNMKPLKKNYLNY